MKHGSIRALIWSGISVVVITAILCGLWTHKKNRTENAFHTAPQGIPNSRAPQLLWDFTAPLSKEPALQEDVKEQVREQIVPITHTSEQVLFTSAVRGAFYPGVPMNSQLAITAVQYSSNRSQVEGPWSFLAIETNGTLELFQNPYGDSVLRSFRPLGSTADLLLSDAEGGEQGEDRHFLRVISAANHSVQLVQSVGIAAISDCAGYGHGTVDDRIFYAQEVANKAGIMPLREHFYKACGDGGNFRSIGSDARNAEQAFLSLPSFTSPSATAGHTASLSDEPLSSNNVPSRHDGCYVPHGALVKGQAAQTRIQFAAKLQAIVDQRVGPAMVAVRAGPPENSWLLVSSLRANEELVRRAETRLDTPEQRASLCLRGFDSASFIVYDDEKHYEELGSFKTDAGEALRVLKSAE